MKRNIMIKSKKDFSNIITKAKKVQNQYFSIHYIKYISSTPHFGIAVPTKFGHAVDRNKIKRQIRNVIDQNKNMFPKNYNYIIMIRKACSKLSFQELENNLVSLLEEKK